MDVFRCLMCARLVWSIDAIAGKNIAYSDGLPRSSVAYLATAPLVRGRVRYSIQLLIF